MHCRRCRPLVWAAVFVAVVGPAASGCSGHRNDAAPTSGGAAAEQAAATVPPGVAAVSPGGVTTQINVPARSSEEEYFQACHAARMWMQGRPPDRQALFEGYLAAVQAPGAVGPGTWNTAWAALPLARQAAVIVAAHAAANDECG